MSYSRTFLITKVNIFIYLFNIEVKINFFIVLNWFYVCGWWTWKSIAVSEIKIFEILIPGF